MHVLLTGGCGYIGTVLTAKLLDRGCAVTVVDALWFGNALAPRRGLRIVPVDIRETDRVPMDGIDAVIHLANIANDPCGDLNAGLSWEVNTLATQQLVERAVRHRVRQFVYASSGSVYGVKEEPEVTEDLSPLPISDYNKTKMVSERVLLSYRDDIIVQCIRPATVCGVSPRMRLDLSVNLLTMQALANGRITVFGGDQTRPNIHIQDITDVFLHMLDAGERLQGVYNAGFENLTIMAIAELVTRFAPAEISVTASNDPRSYRLNADKLKKTGFRPQFGVETAIREICGAFRAGKLTDDDRHYNIRVMKRMQIDE